MTCERSVLRAAAAWVVFLLGSGALESTDAQEQLESALAAITPNVVRSHVQFLSDDHLRGRDTGDAGYEIATVYVASQFRRLGLEPIIGRSYLQPFELLAGGKDLGSELEIGSARIRWPEAVFHPDWLGSDGRIEGEGLYVGYGAVTGERDDYRGVDVKGKMVFLIPGLPPGWDEDPDKSLLLRLKTEIAIRRGARGVITLHIENDAGWRRLSDPGYSPMVLADGSAPSLRADVIAGPDASRRLFEAWGLDPTKVQELADAGLSPRTVGSVRITRSHEIGRSRSWNVGGILRGGDPRLRDEAVVYTAHLDHVGIGEPDEDGDRIFNGTHDNALGTAKMLAAAEAMARLQLRRSVIFLAVGAEERGLLGSWFYVRNAVIPIERTAAAINHDGGRDGEAVDDAFGFGAEFSTLAGALDRAARQQGMRLNEKMLPPLSPSASLLFRSDQYSFLLAGVPAVYLMDGYSVRGDEERGREWWENYLQNVNHQQRDNFREEWSFESAVRMAALSVRLGVELANQDEMSRFEEGAVVKRKRAAPTEPYFYSRLPRGR